MVVLQGPKCIQDGKTILGIDQNIINHMTMIRVVTILVPSSDEEFVGGTELHAMFGLTTK